MTRFAKQNIIVVSLLILFTFPVFISPSAGVYATFNGTNSTSTGQPNQDLTVTSKGCGEGYGYYIDDPNPICEPLDKIGQGPPPADQAFCAALGCPYNPPADSEFPVANDEGFATTPVTPTDEPANGPQPQPEQDTVDEDQNDDNEGGGNGDNSDGGDGSDGSEGGGDDSGGDEGDEG